jgi:pimeloyl-ACP methyl ester carboxylesterase
MMKRGTIRSFIFWSCVLFISAGLQAQHLVSYQLQRHYTIADVEQLLANAGVPTVLLRPEFEVDAYKIIYNTRNAQDTGMTTASGVLIVPSGVACPLPLLSYQHGTTTTRRGVPSYGSDELTIGIIYASGGGYLTTMPDYLGLGDGAGFHPYVHARSEATATVDLLRTARELKDTLGYQLNEQLFLFGYSQGGHATMAAFKLLEEELAAEFTVTAAAPMSGPYDISGVQAGTITSGQAYESPSYLPYVILGYQEAYGDIYVNLSDVFRAPYDSLIPIWYDGTRSTGYIDARLPAVVSDMITPAYYSDFINNPNNRGRQALADNDLYNWRPRAPLRMLYCNGDRQVFSGNSEITYDTMRALGATQVEKYDFGNYSHGGCVQFCLIDGFNFFNRYKDIRGGIGVNVQTTALSSGGAQDGNITVVATAGVAPYSFNWSGGQTTANLSGLAAGTYIVRVSDSRGCFTYQPATVGLVAGIRAEAAADAFTIAPNPGREQIFIRPANNIETGYTYQLRNSLGQIVAQEKTNQAQTSSVYVGQLAAGLYLLDIQAQGQRFTYKLIIE